MNDITNPIKHPEDVRTLLMNHQNGFDDKSIFMVLFKRIPNIIDNGNQEWQKFHEKFLENFSNKILDSYKFWDISADADDKALQSVIYVLAQEVIVSLDLFFGRFRILFHGEENQLVRDLKQHSVSLPQYHIKRPFNVVIYSEAEDGFTFRRLELRKPKFNLKDYYNDDLKAFHEKIYARLKKKNHDSIVLLHGPTGTGKSFYIRYLITRLKRKTIFLSMDMLGKFTNHDFYNFILEHPNALIVIEDADHFIQKQKDISKSPLSALLKVTDGLLADSLNIKVVFSFNIDLQNIHSELLNTNRLIGSYSFKPLSPEKASNLSAKLGKNHTYTLPVKLGDVFHEEELTLIDEKRRNQRASEDQSSE